MALALASVGLFACSATPAMALPGAKISAQKLAPVASYPGVQHLHYEFGPIPITPGQNTIEAAPNELMPKVPGFITRFRPNLVYTKSGKVPAVDVIHLHHGVWLINGYPTMAAGEEKTALNFPKGYGFHSDPDDSWIMNYMIHNLTPTPTSVKLTYDIDFVPDSQPAAANITRAYPLWMDVSGLRAYPVFDAIKGHGKNGRFTFPDHAYGSARNNVGFAQKRKVSQDMTLLGTGGHLHPGGLYNNLHVTRNGQRKLLFQSKAKYFEPAGAVSWDVAMSGSPPDWRVKVRRGDVLSTSATYDTSRAAWWESMGIMVTYMADAGPGHNPFKRRVNFPGRPTHGHLAENDNHGGGPTDLPNPVTRPDGQAVGGPLDIMGFKYALGDLSLPGMEGRPPVVPEGQSITFRNRDDPRAIYHSITSCKPPCNRSTGIAYPVADGPVQFESGTLGSAVPPATGRLEWQTPAGLDPGTYTYFCRIHPFMRGAFRVK
jgi:plastocyanin